MEIMIASGDLCAVHFLITYRAYVVKFFELLGFRLGQGINLIHCRPTFHEHSPAGPGLAPDVEISMDAHHDGPNSPARLEDQYPETVEEQYNAEGELHGVAERPYDVHAVVELLPKCSPVRVDEEQ